MKLILFLLVFFPFVLAAQSTSFPDSNVVFVNSFYQELPFGQIGWPYQLIDVTNFCVDGSDTLIANITYKKVIRCPEQEYHGAYRSENRKVYFVPKDSTNQFLLYDFSVEVGDTIPQVYFEYFYGGSMLLSDYHIYNVDTIVINGNPHKRINDNWVEGIGNVQGFLLEPFYNISMYIVELTCLSIDNASYYPMQDATPCPLDLAVSDAKRSKITISPNPTSDKLIIEGINESTEINVINAQGKIVDFRRLSTHELAVSELAAGVYFVQITQNKQSAIVKFVKKD